ncbi:MAG: C69 family dipeptidase, partial [Acetivibrio ethanolgignens]
EAEKIDAALKIDKKTRDYTSIDNNSKESPIALLHNPDRKMTTYEVLRLLATRGENTPYTQEEGETGYSIGNPRQSECHIFEIRENMPDTLATIQWQTNSPSEFAIYVPYYSALVTSVNDEYNVESLQYVDNSYFWIFSKLNILCSEDRANRADAVKAYFAEYQKSLIEQQKTVDTKMKAIYNESPAKASVVATVLGKNIAKQTYAAAEQVKKELEAYIKAGNTGKPFALSETAKKTMPKYAGLMDTYANDAELLKAVNAEAEAEQDKLVKANEKIAELEAALENAKITAGVKATKVTTTTKAAKGSVKVSWKKSGSYDVDSYRIYRASSKDGTYKLVKEVKGQETSFMLSTKSL